MTNGGHACGVSLQVTQSVFRGPRSLVVIPAQGIVDFRNAIQKLVEEYGAPEDLEAQGEPLLSLR